MDVTDALLAGLLSSGGIAMQFGAVSALPIVFGMAVQFALAA